MVKLHGQTQQYGLRSDYVFYRDHDQIDSLSGQLTYKRIDNYFESVRLEVSSPTLTTAELSASRLQILPNGVFSANLSVEQGLPWLGPIATRARCTSTASSPRASCSPTSASAFTGRGDLSAQQPVLRPVQPRPAARRGVA